ncbi:MipA/OmpV family protein [Kiloniella majae]|uniref:MipA/OmpV family protein n=1 Tax=Kiloniella majae TaxID=1938558 RepID=UPI000A2777F4|nr:MipA/OmpV family protein [Kiloniella majae]
MKVYKLRSFPLVLGAITAAFFYINSPHAEDVKVPSDSDVWDLELGAIGGFSPDYEGSDDYEVMGLPYVHAAWNDTVILTMRDGPGIYLQHEIWDDFSAKAGIRYEFGRDENDNDALEGLGDLDVGAVAVGALAYEYGPFEFSAELVSDLTGDREGTKATFVADYRVMVLENKGRFSFGPSITWADDNYMENTFGINATQAAASRNNYAIYDAEGGIKDVGLNASFSYALTENISLLATGGYSRLLGDAADSPIVDDEGSANQFNSMLGLIYRW